MLRPGMRRINLVAKVVEKTEPREVISRTTGETHMLSEATVGDETGTVTLTLWDDAINIVDEGETYLITNSYTSTFKGELRLNIGRYGKIEKTDQEVTEVNIENNLSRRRFEQPTRYRKKIRYR